MNYRNIPRYMYMYMYLDTEDNIELNQNNYGLTLLLP